MPIETVHPDHMSIRELVMALQDRFEALIVIGTDDTAPDHQLTYWHTSSDDPGVADLFWDLERRLRKQGVLSEDDE